MSIKITGFDFDKLEKDIKSKALHTQFDFEYPHCHQTIKVKYGSNVCPSCGQKINVEKGPGWD